MSSRTAMTVIYSELSIPHRYYMAALKITVITKLPAMIKLIELSID